MILSGSAIKERLKRGEIFDPNTCDERCIKEASYTLRVAPDGLLINGEPYPPGMPYPSPFLRIEPGKIAILSTIERFKMPKDVVGRQGIRFDYAVQGLTGLWGIQVDPLFGSNVPDERLYLRFANLGNDTVVIQPGDAVFNIEFQTVDGEVNKSEINQREGERRPMWERLMRSLKDQSDPSWSHVTQVQVETQNVRTDLETRSRDMRADLAVRVEDVRQGLQPLVMFGVFLVAATLLGAVIAVLLSFDTPTAAVPSWVTNWVWIVLVAFIGIAALATTAIGISTSVVFIKWAKTER